MNFKNILKFLTPIIILIILVVFIGIINNKDIKNNENNIQIGLKYEEAILKEKPIILVFYTPWCTFCKRLLERLEVIENDYKDKFSIVLINCDEKKNFNFIQKYSIKKYPTIYIVNPQTNKRIYFYAGYTENLIDFRHALDNYLTSY